mgnify:CR=1 FL=1
MLISMQDIQRKHTGHWFSRDTMRFFLSRVGEYGYQGPGGVYFVSSERFSRDGSPRLYTVRRQDPDGSIETVGEFQGYKSRSGAHAAAKRYAKGGAS